MNLFLLIGLIMAIWKIYEFATQQKEKKSTSSPRYRLQDLLNEWDEIEEDEPFVSPSNQLVTQGKAIEPSVKSNQSRVSDRFRLQVPNQLHNQNQKLSSSFPKQKPKLSPSQVKKAFVYREVLGAPRALNPYASKKFPR